MEFKFTLTGHRRISNILRNLVNFARDKDFLDILQRIKEEALREAKRNAPVKFGRLRANIRGRILNYGTRKPDIEIYVDEAKVPYANIVAEGSKKHIILPKRGKWLHWIGEKGEVWVRKVGPPVTAIHPGTKPNPFLERTMQKMRPRLIRRLEEVLNKKFKE